MADAQKCMQMFNAGRTCSYTLISLLGTSVFVGADDVSSQPKFERLYGVWLSLMDAVEYRSRSRSRSRYIYNHMWMLPAHHKIRLRCMCTIPGAHVRVTANLCIGCTALAHSKRISLFRLTHFASATCAVIKLFLDSRFCDASHPQKLCQLHCLIWVFPLHELVAVERVRTCAALFQSMHAHHVAAIYSARAFLDHSDLRARSPDIKLLLLISDGHGLHCS
jgi:hypothetical protein